MIKLWPLLPDGACAVRIYLFLDALSFFGDILYSHDVCFDKFIGYSTRQRCYAESDGDLRTPQASAMGVCQLYVPIEPRQYARCD